jgi:signal transduction histidine kinase
VKYDRAIATALADWLSDGATFGVLVTDSEMTVLFANVWLQRSLGTEDNAFVGSNLFAAFPDLIERGFDRYYKEAVAGQVRVLSHRFHKYLIPIPSTIKRDNFPLMQQSCTIAPFMSGDSIIGTVTVIGDVTERVALESELNHRIAESQRLLAAEISARESAEEINRINSALMTEGAEMLQTRRVRDLLMHKILVAQEEERHLIARDIHDNLGQQMTALRLAILRLRSRADLDPDLADQIKAAEGIATQLDREVGFLARRVRPALIDDLGLEAALRAFIDEWSRHVGISVNLHSHGLNGIRLQPEVEINLYRIAQEALNNVSKHSQSKRVDVLLENRENGLVLIVEDNGKGFIATGERSPKNGLGLFSMQERCSLIGADLQIESKPGRGTTLYVRLEIPSTNAHADLPLDPLT